MLSKSGFIIPILLHNVGIENNPKSLLRFEYIFQNSNRNSLEQFRLIENQQSVKKSNIMT